MSEKAEQKKIEQVVSRVMSEISKETIASEKSFGVDDLRGQLVNLAEAGGPVAWEISYKTSAANITVKPGFQEAWEISYKTNAASLSELKKG